MLNVTPLRAHPKHFLTFAVLIFFCLATKAMARVQEQKQSITTLQTQIERESQAMQHCSEASDKLLHLQHKAILLGEEAQYVETLLPAFATHTHTHTHTEVQAQTQAQTQTHRHTDTRHDDDIAGRKKTQRS